MAVIAQDGLYAKNGWDVRFLSAGTECKILNNGKRTSSAWLLVSVDGEGIFYMCEDEVVIPGQRVRS